MPKVTLNKDAFKALASDTRLEIIRTLDGKKMSLNELVKETNLNKATLHEHLSRLIEVGLVKRIQREGHKWVYYKLSWKGESLLHPENSKIVIVFAIAFTVLLAGFFQMYLYIKQLNLMPINSRDYGYALEKSNDGSGVVQPYDTLTQTGSSTSLIPSDIWLYAAIICFLIFIVLLVFSIHKLWKNKHSLL